MPGIINSQNQGLGTTNDSKKSMLDNFKKLDDILNKKKEEFATAKKEQS